MNQIPTGGRLGRYKIERMLGAGAMGEVYLAEDPQIGRRVAVKTVRVEEGKPAEMEERKRRLLREARAAGKLMHPNVVALFDAGEDQGILYLAFECIVGTDLAQRLEVDPPLTLREALNYVRQAAEGLDYAHRQGIVHRDIKPSNLLLGPGGQIKVSDFGIAKLAEQTSELTMTGSVVGSPHYLSPEQIRGDELDGRSDIFSLGVLFYEVLSRQRPFTGETLTTLVYQILHRDPPSIVVNRPELGTRLEGVLQRMLQKDRDQRFATAGEVARALALCEQEIPVAVLDRPAAPPDTPPLDGTRRMSTSERAADVVPAGGEAPGAPPPPPPPAGLKPPPTPPAPATAETELLATRVRGSSGAGARQAPRFSKTGLIAVAAVVVVVLAALVVGGLTARRWAAAKLQKAEPRNATTTSTEPATTVPATTATQLAKTPAREPQSAPDTAPAPADPSTNAPDPGQRFQQTPARTEPAVAPAPVRTTPERPKGPVAEPKPASPARENPPAPATTTKPAPAPEETAADSSPADEAAEPVPPVAERPGIAPQIDRVVMTGMALSFAVEPEDAIIKVDNRVIGQAWTWNAKKKEGRAYDLPEAGDHLVRILAAGKTYTLRVIASEGAPSPTIIAVDLESGGKSTRRRRGSDKP